MSGKVAYIIDERRGLGSATSQRYKKNQDRLSPASDIPSKSKRVRGRPRGKPAPLNAEQRRQRNAQYERERRIEQADALQELTNALNIDENTPMCQVLEAAYARLTKKRPSTPIETIARENANYEAKIAKYERKLLQMDMAAYDTPSTSSSSSSPPLDKYYASSGSARTTDWWKMQEVN